MEFLKSILEENRKRKNKDAAPQARASESSLPSMDDKPAKKAPEPADNDSQSIEQTREPKRQAVEKGTAFGIKHAEYIVTAAVNVEKSKKDTFEASIIAKKSSRMLVPSLQAVEEDITETIQALYEKLTKHDTRAVLKLVEYILHHSTINELSWRYQPTENLKCFFNNKVIGNYVVNIRSDILSIYMKAVKDGRASKDNYKQFKEDLLAQKYTDPQVPIQRSIRVCKEKLLEIIVLVQFCSYRLLNSAVWIEPNMSIREIFDKYALLKTRIENYVEV